MGRISKQQAVTHDGQSGSQTANSSVKLSTALVPLDRMYYYVIRYYVRRNNHV